MSIYIDRKYLLLASSRLSQFKEKSSDLYNFRCPFCGDSQKNKLKARGYVFKAQDYNGYGYKCWNCNISTNFNNLLKFIDPLAYKEYSMEKFQDKNGIRCAVIPDKAPIFVNPIFEEPLHVNEVDLPNMNELEDDHFAKAYIMARKIPNTYYDQIFFACDFKRFLDETFPNHGKKGLIEDDARIVMFYTEKNGRITIVNGRSFGANPKLRYLKVKILDYKKIFGIHRLDITKRIYVTEGEFDSMFLDNAIASGDSNLSGISDWMYDTYGADTTLVYDKEPRNLQLVETIEKAIDASCDVTLLPETFPGKDINEAVLAGLSVKEITDIIDANTFRGLMAKLRLSSWRKC